MKKIQLLVFSLIMVAVLGCTKNENQSGNESVEQLQNEMSGVVSSSNQYLDSIQNIDSRIENLMSMLEAKREQISYLNAKKDSILNATEQVRISLEQIKSKKINPGIEGVNKKLDELKGQKENLQEQQALQKQEVLLAEKKIQLQNEEKEVYNAQRKALWDKGAPPADFVKVDSLLAGIDSYLNEQSDRMKNLKRSIADIDEKVTAIDQQRNSLSSKIRNNYTAQQIYEDFSSEEKVRLEKQLVDIEEQLKVALIEQEDLNSRIALKSGDKNYLQIKQDELKTQEMSNAARLEQIASEKQQTEMNKASRNKMILNAFIWICIIGLLIFALYYIGKKRRIKKTK